MYSSKAVKTSPLRERLCCLAIAFICSKIGTGKRIESDLIAFSLVFMHLFYSKIGCMSRGKPHFPSHLKRTRFHPREGQGSFARWDKARSVQPVPVAILHGVRHPATA